MITLWGRASSSNVQMVHWALLEFGVPFDRIDAGEGFGGLDSPEFLAMNPHGKIPVLQDGALTLFESCAILRYLAGAYGPQDAWPIDPAQRAVVDQWAEWAKQGPSNRFTGPIFWRVVRTPAARRDPAAIAGAIQRFETELRIAEDRLTEHAWLCGDRMTIGDMILGHVLFRYYDIDISRQDFPAVRAFYENLTSRSAYQQAVMLPYDELRDTI